MDLLATTRPASPLPGKVLVSAAAPRDRTLRSSPFPQIPLRGALSGQHYDPSLSLPRTSFYEIAFSGWLFSSRRVVKHRDPSRKRGFARLRERQVILPVCC